MSRFSLQKILIAKNFEKIKKYVYNDQIRDILKIIFTVALFLQSVKIIITDTSFSLLEWNSEKHNRT